MKKLKICILFLFAFMLTCSKNVWADSIPMPTWAQDDVGHVRYFTSVDSYMIGQHKIKGKTYYFDSDGYLTFDWVKTKSGKKFYSINGTVGKLTKVKTVKGDYKTGSVYGPKLSKKELSAVQKAVKSFINNNIATNMTDYEKVCAAHDYLCKICSYSGSTNYSKTKSNTAYGALIKKKAACSGYARAFKALCDAMNIKCYWVKATNKSHQWNIVKVGKSYYHIDVQCNDSSGFNAIFLTSDREMKNCGLKWKASFPKCKNEYNFTITLP